MKVLVCDDSPVNLQLIGAYLKQMGHQVIFAENGEQAVELYTSQQPDLVLIDVEMPTLDGYEATKMMRHQSDDFSKWTPVIFISSHVDDESIVKGIEAGGDDYLTKPVSMPVLRAKIHAMRRLVAMRENLIDFGKQLREANEKLMNSNQLLAEMSLKDPLTRLGNRRAFEETINRVSRIATRENKPLSLLMIDVDHFKHFNDTYGHQAGDRCLQQCAMVFKRGLHRASDFAARYGGEEFAILLLDTPLTGAMHVAERLRMGIEAYQIPNTVGSKNGVVTISVGVACANPTEQYAIESFVEAADKALYEAKTAGRNCVVSAKSESAIRSAAIEQLHQRIHRFPSTGSNSKH